MSRPQLREALQSVDRQTFRDFEIVVGDNSGETATQRAIDAILAEFSHLSIRVVRHDKTLDAAVNFNSTVDAARGDLWSLLPDDDRICPTFLARSVEALDAHPDCSFTFADHWIIRADGTIDEARSVANSLTFGRASLKEGVFRDEALFGVVLAQSTCLQTALFRRGLVKSVRFIPDISALDFALFLRLSTVLKPVSAYYIAERLTEYRVHSGQITTVTDRADLLKNGIAALESVDSVPRRHRRQYRRKLGRQYLALALAEAETGANAAARRHAVKSLSIWISARATVGAGLVLMAPRSVRLTRRLIAGLRPDGRR
jgi:glycosyltransferase involved in cell wall biosynthesis